ncbi:MAG: hypothetical protein AABY22_35595 [Nanoarchaeota archaeon]
MNIQYTLEEKDKGIYLKLPESEPIFFANTMKEAKENMRKLLKLSQKKDQYVSKV